MATRICKECILNMKPYIPGKPIEEVQREYGLTDIIKLASNENPLGPSPKAVEAMKAACEMVGLYPDGSCFALRQAVAKHAGVPADHLTFGAGSDELIREIGNTFLSEGDSIIQGDPTFSQYEGAATVNGCKCINVANTGYEYDVEELIKLIDATVKIVYLANPNNPVGTIVTQAQVERILEALPQSAILVLDEAYNEYIEHPDFPNAVPWVLEGKNVIIFRTFSKIYALAGARLGYAIARPELINLIERVRLPFNVSSIAQAGAIAALEDKEHIEKSRKLNAEGRKYFCQEFDRMGLTYAPSHTNFVWVDIKAEAKTVFTELLKRGIIIRTGDPFGCPTHIRVTMGTAEQNARFIAALEEVLRELQIANCKLQNANRRVLELKL